MFRRITPAAILAAALVSTSLAQLAQAEIIVGLTFEDRIVTFDTTNPSVLLSTAPISGYLGTPKLLNIPRTGEFIVSIDTRPADGKVYAVSNEDRLYTLNPLTGAVTAVPVTGTPFAAPYFGPGEVDIDFNPQADRVRYVRQNFNARLNPNDGLAVDGNAAAPGLQPDGNLAYVAGDTNVARTPNAIGTAYTNPDTNPATPTRQYTLDRILGGTNQTILAEQTNFNAGALTTVNTVQIDRLINTLAGFDISASGLAYLGFSDTPVAFGAARNNLFTLDLATGQATLLSDLIPTTSGLLIDVTAAIPEPSHLALLAPVAGLLLRRRSVA